MAKLTFIFSSMNSGKSLSLLTKNFMLREKGYSTILMKPAVDDRTKTISSRLGIEEKCVILSETMLPSEAMYIEYTFALGAPFVNYILVDEAQFLTKEQVWDLSKIVDDYGIDVICYGLKLDWQGEFFTGSHELMKIADELIQTETVCRTTGGPALFHIKRGGSDLSVETGYDDLYDTVSRSVWRDWWENRK
jgi:thymidine kinase